MGYERGFLWLQRTFWQVLLALFSSAIENGIMFTLTSQTLSTSS